MFTVVYSAGVVEETYRFDEAAYDAVSRAGIGWQSVLDVLRARPRVRQYIGAVLRVAAQDRHGRWVAVALIEEDDNAYLVVSARELDADEQVAVSKMLGGTA
jgi:hypothetical protein